MFAIEKKLTTTSAPGGKNYPVSVGTIGYTEQTVSDVPGLASLPDVGKDDRVLVIESFYNYLASGSINDRRSLFQGVRVGGVGAVLLKKLARLAEAGGPASVGITRAHPYLYVAGTKRQAWDNYRAYGFRPVGSNAMVWRAKTEELLNSVRDTKVTVTEAVPGGTAGPRGAKVPSLFAMSLNALTTDPGARATLLDPADATLRKKVVLGGTTSADGFVVNRQ